MSAVSVMFNLLDGAKDLVLGLPFGLYGTFVVEQKHGFNKQTLGLFLMDQLKSVSLAPRSLTHCVSYVVAKMRCLGLPFSFCGPSVESKIIRHSAQAARFSCCFRVDIGQPLRSLACTKQRLCGHVQVGIGLVMMPPVIAAFTWILQHTGPMVPLYLWSFIFGLQIFFMTIYPIAIAPLFNKFSPLEKGTLKCAHTRDPGAVIQVFLHIVPASYRSNSWIAAKPHRSSPCMRGLYCRPANNCRASRWGF